MAAPIPPPPESLRPQLAPGALIAPLGLTIAMVAAFIALPGSPHPEPGALIAAGGGLASLGDAPRAAFIHASLTHLVVNLALTWLLGAVWYRVGNLPGMSAAPYVRGTRRALAATAIPLAAGMTSLAISAALTPEARVGASGGVHALLGALLASVWIRRAWMPEPLRKSLLPNLALVTLPLIGLQLVASDGIDWLAHVVGFALGFPLALAVERAHGATVLLGVVAVWMAIAWV